VEERVVGVVLNASGHQPVVIAAQQVASWARRRSVVRLIDIR
jgi:hypothetical protein